MTINSLTLYWLMIMATHGLGIPCKQPVFTIVSLCKNYSKKASELQWVVWKLSDTWAAMCRCIGCNPLLRQNQKVDRCRASIWLVDDGDNTMYLWMWSNHDPGIIDGTTNSDIGIYIYNEQRSILDFISKAQSTQLVGCLAVRGGEFMPHLCLPCREPSKLAHTVFWNASSHRIF